ncbi:hypothetical protein [Brevibacterium album]|uniref:hypothetical protein n=1 Tax=Brevibacterium album TaxID=417948 RepID=UPI00040A300F|nr:hypothetical protein [Brevibacterium album]
MAEFAVAGSPVAHSLSPLLHRAAAAALGLSDFSYGRCELTAGELAPHLDAHPGLRGLSATMPLKRRLAELAAARGWRRAPAVEATGAANTLLRTPDGGEVLNTDVGGIVAAVREAAETEAWAEVDVLGGGATAGSALAAAAELGCVHANLFVRSRNRAGEARSVAEAVGLTTTVCELPDWVPGERGLTLSTLPAGVMGPAAAALPARIEAVVFDAAYAAEAHAWHRALTGHGARVVDGSRMLLHQAVAQHVRFAALAGLSAAAAEAARPAILAAMEAALAERA